ncbi:MAG TPA: hypothetical protein VGB47_07445 [Thermoanaerobaculia bacterium]|jgi:hypothetical protein
MSGRITREEALAFRIRWAEVNAFQRREARATTPVERLGQLNALIISDQSLGWAEALGTGEDVVRERWNLLRRRYGV